MKKIERQLDNPDILNEVMNNSEDFENKKSLEILNIDLENSKEILLRKKTALLQTLDILENVVVYGELDREINLVKESIEDIDFDVKQLDNDIEEINSEV